MLTPLFTSLGVLKFNWSMANTTHFARMLKFAAGITVLMVVYAISVTIHALLGINPVWCANWLPGFTKRNMDLTRKVFLFAHQTNRNQALSSIAVSWNLLNILMANAYLIAARNETKAVLDSVAVTGGGGSSSTDRRVLRPVSSSAHAEQNSPASKTTLVASKT